MKVKQEEVLLKSMPKELQRAWRFASIFDKMNRGEAIMMLPFDLEIK